MTDKTRDLLMRCVGVLCDARRLWPQKHPASGLIVGLDEDCRDVYRRLLEVSEECLDRAFEPENENDWRPIETAPDNDSTVFLAADGELYMGYFYDGYWWVGGERMAAAWPTHWMPLPEPPE